MIWVLSGDAPIADLKEFAVLATMAEAAGRDGCGTFQSKETIAERTTLDTESVKRAWRAMVRRGLIGKGDQTMARHIRADRRPTVYDLLIPYEWFPNIERTNAERARMGLDPLTPENRPPIAPAPAKKARADKGMPRPKAEQDSKPRGNSESPRAETPEDGHGGTTSRRRGNYKSSTGELQEPRTSTSNPTTEPGDPSVPPSFPDPDARAKPANGTDERTDGGEVSQHQEQQPGKPAESGEVPTAPAPPVASAGVMLLLEIGTAHPELAVSAPTLAEQGAVLDARLAAGWPVGLLRAWLTAPGKDPVRSADAVIAYRIRHLPLAPGVLPTADSEGGPVVPHQEQRSVAQEIGQRVRHECSGQDGLCGRQVNAAGELCPLCRKPCSADCGRGPAHPSRQDGLCLDCVRDAGAARCMAADCDRLAVHSDGLCHGCHRERVDAEDAARAIALLASELEAYEPEETTPAPF